MKTHLIINFVFSACCFFFSLNLQAQEVAKSINLETAGTLNTLIPENEKYTVTDLKLSGTINGKDILFLREMVGRDFNGDSTAGVLANLNMAEVNIVSGGTYFHSETNDDEYQTHPDTINDYVFYNCSGLKQIILPNTVKYIVQNAFKGCTGLTSIILPKKNSTLNDAFEDCKNLTSFIVDIENINFSTSDGVLFTKDKTVLLLFPNGKGSQFTIPNDVKTINSRAFSGCVGLTSLTMPNNVKYIGSYSFNNCTKLTSIILSDSLSIINEYSFNNCTGLTTLIVPNNVTLINWESFNDCTNLINLTLSEKIKYIFFNTFNNCPNLSEIHFLSKLAPPLFGDDAFNEVDKSNCKLYIPYGSTASYKRDKFWGSFSNIIEDATAINDPKTESIIISASEGGIQVQTQKAIPVVVYSLSGTKVFDKTVTKNEFVTLKNGFYLVKALGKTMKVVVK